MKKKLKVLALSMIVATGVIGCSKNEVKGDNKKVVLVLDEGGVNDQSFNQSAWEGAQRASEKYGVEVSYIEAKQESDYETNIETAIDNGADLVVGVGFKITDAIEEASENYPEQNFALIDGTYEDIPDNVRPILFSEEQAGYYVGLIASKMTTSKKVGFIGGMDIPSCSNFAVGFEKALKEEDSNIEFVKQYANSFTDASKGRAIAEQMVSQGADILFMAGGGVNSGVLEVCIEKGVKAIGVDLPSNHLAPDTVITSALKNIGSGLESTIKDLVDGNFKGGEAKIYDATNGGVGYEKTDLIPQEVIEYIESK